MTTLSEAYKAQLERSKKEWYERNAPLGKDLGYPECCINEFCAASPEILKAFGIGDEHYSRYAASFVNGKYTGFIPCLRHAKQILEGEITLASLIKNRSSKFPEFPKYGAHGE